MKFQLYGVLVHQGTSTSGHYYVDLNIQISNKWYCFNDSTAKQIDSPQTSNVI
jgi:ubiquitin C-terminal hydrolase